MPLSQDPKGGGTEADGSRSTEFCSYCYQNGAFFEPNMTLEQMIAKLEPIMAGMHMPSQVIERTKATLPQLKRWRVPSVH
jgi:hypothetical protein